MTFFKENNTTSSNTEVTGNTKELENNPHQLANSDMGFLKHTEPNWEASSGVLKKRCPQLCVAEFNVLKWTSERAGRHGHGRTRASISEGRIRRGCTQEKRTLSVKYVCGRIGGTAICHGVHALSLLNIYTHIYSSPWVCVIRRIERKYAWYV